MEADAESRRGGCLVDISPPRKGGRPVGGPSPEEADVGAREGDHDAPVRLRLQQVAEVRRMAWRTHASRPGAARALRASTGPGMEAASTARAA